MSISDEWTVKRMLEWATIYFKSRGLESPRLLIEWLLSELLEVKRLDLYLNFDRPLSSTELEILRPKIKELAHGKPLQYVLGYEQFHGLRIKTDQRALIPRPETEELLMEVLNFMNKDDSYRVLDIGTGTGCIPLAIKSQREQSLCVGIDVSEDALSLAKENAEQLKLDVRFLRFDMNAYQKWPADKKIDVLISNPPYIHPSEVGSVDAHVHQFEPHLALYVEDVLKVYITIAKWAECILAEGGALFLELNPIYADQIYPIFSALFEHLEIKNDLANKRRFLCGFGRK